MTVPVRFMAAPVDSTACALHSRQLKPQCSAAEEAIQAMSSAGSAQDCGGRIPCQWCVPAGHAVYVFGGNQPSTHPDGQHVEPQQLELVHARKGQQRHGQTSVLHKRLAQHVPRPPIGGGVGAAQRAQLGGGLGGHRLRRGGGLGGEESSGRWASRNNILNWTMVN